MRNVERGRRSARRFAFGTGAAVEVGWADQLADLALLMNDRRVRAIPSFSASVLVFLAVGLAACEAMETPDSGSGRAPHPDADTPEAGPRDTGHGDTGLTPGPDGGDAEVADVSLHDAGDSGVCVCLPAPDLDGPDNLCDCPAFTWGCVDAPQTFRVCDAPRPCWEIVTDPGTGCPRPTTHFPCAESCHPLPDLGRRDPDAG